MIDLEKVHDFEEVITNLIWNNSIVYHEGFHCFQRKCWNLMEFELTQNYWEVCTFPTRLLLQLM